MSEEGLLRSLTPLHDRIRCLLSPYSADHKADSAPSDSCHGYGMTISGLWSNSFSFKLKKRETGHVDQFRSYDYIWTNRRLGGGGMPLRDIFGCPILGPDEALLVFNG